jgi:poly-beta-1,6-N-acetyl-D-glucosamine synthase
MSGNQTVSGTCENGIPSDDNGTCAGAYALMTAAYNEEENIEHTILSVLSQTTLPRRWVIVSDGSIDKTDAIVQSYETKHEFIRFVQITRDPGRSFASKIVALQNGSRLLEDVEYDFIGNIDADISVGPSYFEDLITHFRSDPKLGLAGGYVRDKNGDNYESNRTNRIYAVAHGAQLVRRECYEAIGGYAVLRYGGEDWHAHVSAALKGWTAESFPELYMLHHRPTGDAENMLRYKFREGRMDYSLGSDPTFEFFKCLERMLHRPFLTGGIARLTGFFWSWICQDSRPVSDEFIIFLRKDQRERLKLLFRRSSPFSVNAHHTRSN